MSHKEYTAYYLHHQLTVAIISVLASSSDEAKERVEEELKKPGRGEYWQLWHKDDRLVKEKAP